jgi:hypothetical protein
MANTNKHGLSRTIPAKVMLEVRQRSKFGCVICRNAICQYEHIEPGFADATAHDSEHICLLCGGCHDKVTRGRISKQEVRERYNAVMASSEVRPPFEELHLAKDGLAVKFGKANFIGAGCLLRVNGQDILSITPPADGDSAPRLNGVFHDSAGKESLRIIDNTWEGVPDAWDIQTVGKGLVIKSYRGETSIDLEIESPSQLVVRELNMYLDDCHIMTGEEGLIVGVQRDKEFVYLEIGGMNCYGPSVAVEVDSRGEWGPPTGLSIQGGEGVHIHGTGIRVGRGAPSMTVRDIKIWI